MAKMNTIESRAVGACQLDDHNEGRIERNLFAVEWWHLGSTSVLQETKTDSTIAFTW